MLKFTTKNSKCAGLLLNRNVRSVQTSAQMRNDEKPGFLDRVFGTRVEKATQAHSVLLADQQILYELQSNFI